MSTDKNQIKEEIIQKETSNGIKVKIKLFNPNVEKEEKIVKEEKKNKRKLENPKEKDSKKRKIENSEETELLEEIPSIIETLYKEDKSEIFWYPVTDEIVPGYSEIIKNPMDLSHIKTKKYETIQDFWDDVELMLNNAITFNDSSTFFHTESKRILKSFQRIKRRIEQKRKKETQPVESKTKVEVEPTKKRVPKKKEIVHELTNLQNEFIKIIDKLMTKDKLKIFHDPVPQDVPGYFEMIKEPMDFSTLKDLIHQNQIQTNMEFTEKLNLIFTNCLTFNEKKSIFCEEAEKLQKYATELVSKSSNIKVEKKEIKETFPILENELLKEIMKLFLNKLESEDTLQIFISPVPQDVPGYYEMIKEPMDFSTMKNKVENNVYQNWEEFEEDFELSFNNAKTFNTKHSIYYQEAVKLQRSLQRLKKKCLVIYSTEKLENFLEAFKHSLINQKSSSHHGASSVGTTGSNLDSKKKSTLSSLLKQLITDIMKQDKKKLFLYPVNTHEVVDYLTVVKTPMDFTTMKNKKYSTLKEFKEDFILVCENAKAYNEPFTIYHKEADRIQEIGLEMINESKKVEILPEPEEDEESQNEFEDEDEFGDERDGTSEKRGGGANRRGDKSKSKKEIGQRLSFGISTQKKIPNYTRFEISKIPSIVKKFSESIQELSENEFLNMQNCTIDELYLQLNDQQKTSIDTTSEEKYVSSLSNFVESITNQSKNLSNVLQKYGLTNGKEINLDVSKFLSLEIKNSEIIKDIENVEGDFDLTLEVKKYLE